MADGSKLTHIELLKQLSALSAYKTQLLQQLASQEHHLDNSPSNTEPPQPQISLPTTTSLLPSTCPQVHCRTLLLLFSYRRYQQPPKSHFTTAITKQTNHPHLYKTQPLSQIRPIFIHLHKHHHHRTLFSRRHYLPQQFWWTSRRPTRHGRSAIIQWRILKISIRLIRRQNYMVDPSPPCTMRHDFPSSDGANPTDLTIDVPPDLAALQKVAAELSPNEFTCLKFVDWSTIHFAHILFDQIPEPAWYMWNTMLRSSTPSSYPILTISLTLGIWVRSWIKLFDQMPYQYIAIWNAVITGYINNGYAIKCGFTTDSYLHICLLDMYEKCAAIGKGFAIESAALMSQALFGVQAILDNLPSANRIYLVDLGITSGSHWTIVMQALTVRTKYPVEHLKIIAVGTYRMRLEMTSERLLSFAQTMKLPFSFSFKLVESYMKELKKYLFELETGEALAIYS